MSNKTEKLKFGDIICIKLAKDAFYFSSPGFVSNNIELTKIFAVQQKDFQECLFQIIPPLTYHTLQMTQISQIKENQKSTMNMDKNQILDKVADEIIEQENVKNMNKGIELTYHQDFLLQHVSSKKILSIQENDSGSYHLTLEMIPSIDFTLNIMEFYKFRNNKENNISYNEKVLIQLSLLSQRYKSYYFDISDQGFANLANVSQIDNDEIQFNVEDTRFTPIIFELYENALDGGSQSEQIKAGDLVCIDHLKSQGNLYLNKKLSLLERNREILLKLEKKSQKIKNEQNDEDELQDFYDFEKDNNYLQQQQEREIEETQVEIRQTQKFKNCCGHWIVEKLSINQGGPIMWGEGFRLKNLENGKYLSFKQDTSNKLSDLILQDIADETTEFFLEDEKGQMINDQQTIEYGETFSIQRKDKKNKAQFQAAEVYFDNTASNLKVRISQENLEVESFKFMKSTQLNCWELKFIKDCQQQLQKAIIEFFTFSNSDFWVSVSTKQCLDSMRDLIKKIKDFLFSEGYFSQQFFSSETVNQKRLELFVSSEMHDLLYLVIEKIFPNEKCLQRIIKYSKLTEQEEEYNENNNLFTHNAYLTQTSQSDSQQINLGQNPLQIGSSNQNQPNKKKSLVKNIVTQAQSAASQLAKNIEKEENFNNIALVKRLKIDAGEELFPRNQIAKELIQIVEGSYDLLSYFVTSSSFDCEKIREYLNMIIMHTGNNLDIWSCLDRILSNFQMIDEKLPRNLSYMIEKTNLFKSQNLSYLHLIIISCQNEISNSLQGNQNIINLFAQICILNAQLNRKPQTIIGKILFDQKFRSSQVYDKFFIKFKLFKNQIHVKYSEKYLDLESFISKTEAFESIYQLFYSQLRLMALLCEKRNYNNICIIRQFFPYKVIYQYLNNPKISYKYKSVLADLYLYLYIDVNPRSHHMTWETKIQNQRNEMISQKLKIESNQNVTDQDDYEKSLFLLDEDLKVIQIEDIQNEYNPIDWVKTFKSYLLEFFEETFYQDKYKKLAKQPGYYNYILSMIKILTNLITLKEFDISDPDCEEDDQILNWIFHFLQELNSQNGVNTTNLRSKATKQGLGQSFSKPHLKTLQMDFQSNNTDSQLISSLKGLILDIYELKVRILQDQTIDKFLDHSYDYIQNNIKQMQDPFNNGSISESRLVGNNFQGCLVEEKCEQYALNNFIYFAERELDIKNSIKNGDEFEICSEEFVQMMFYQFQQSTEFELDFKLLKLIFFIGNRKSEFIKQLKKTQFVISEGKKNSFLNLNQKVEKMRQLQQRSQTWIQAKENLQKKIANTYLAQLQDIIQMLESDYDLMHNTDEAADDFLYISQKSLSSLNLQQVILDMIQENMIISDPIYADQQLIDKIYISSFKLLGLLVKDNGAMKQEFIKHMPLLMKLMKKKEYGQTQLVIDIYSNDFYTQQQINSNMIDIFVHQIQQKVEKNVIDPSFLSFFFKIISYQGDIIEDNVKLIIENIFFTKRAYIFFGMELQENKNFYNNSQKQILSNQDVKQQQQFLYRFKRLNQNNIDFNPEIYQANAFMTTREILMNSGNQKVRLQQVLQTILDFDYLVSMFDNQKNYYYKKINETSFQNLIFRTELLKLIQDVYLGTQDLPNKIFKYDSIKKFLKNEIEWIPCVKKAGITLIRKKLGELRQLVQKSKTKNPYQTFIQTYYKRQVIKDSDMVYEQYEYTNYMFDILLPMMISIKKALILKAQQSNQSPSQIDVNQFLRLKGWGLLEDFADKFINFFEEDLEQKEQILCTKLYKAVLMEFKTIFQRNKPNINYKNEGIKYNDINFILEEEDGQNNHGFNENIKTANISKNLPELRNILCLSRERYDSEAFKNILIHILTNPLIREELVLDESSHMVELLKKHIDFEDDNKTQQIIQNQNILNYEKQKSVSPKMNTLKIIDNLLKFIEIGLSFLQNHDQVRKTVREAIQLLCELTECFDDERELQKLQNYIFDSSLERILMNVFGTKENYFDELLIGQILRLVIALTRNGNSDIQSKLIIMFKQSPRIEYLVNFIDQCIKGETMRIESMNQNLYMKKYVILNQISYNYDKSDRHAINHCYNFIQSLNQNHYKPFQIFWRHQSHCNNSYDITDSLVKLIDTIVRFQFSKERLSDEMMSSDFRNTINMNAYQKEMLKESLETILSLIQGKSIENKQKVLQSSLIENFGEIIKVNEFKIKSKSNIMRLNGDELTQIRLNLQEFYEGILQEDDVVMIKNLCFEILEHLTEDDNQLAVIRKKVVRILTFKNLQQNLVNIYERFENTYKKIFSLKNENVFEYAFQIFLLIKDYEDTNRILKACHISKKQPKRDLDFYHAYMFFHKNTGTIELINENGQLQEITFAYLPHFNALNKDIQDEFEDKINRDNAQSKIISLMNLSKPFNQKLLNEQQFIDAASTNKVFKTAIVLSQNQPYLRGFNFFLTLLDNIYLLAILAPVTKENGQVNLKEFGDAQALDDALFQITLWIQNVIVTLSFIFFIIQNKSYIKWLIEEQKKKERIVPVDQNQVTVLQGLQKQRRKLSKFAEFRIWFNYWFNNQSVAYFFFFTPVLLLSNFYHELFVTLLLLDFLVRFPETQNVFKAFWAPKWKLLTNICLYLLFMYYFSILAYMTLTDYYHGTCENLLTCFSVIFDNAQKQRIAKLYATLDMYQEKQPAYLLEGEDLFDFFFMLFVVSCIWTWTFTSLIIESYGNLRRTANAISKDKHHVCLVCTLPREKVAKLCSHGFDKHQTGEHNQWNYLRYMASLYYKNSEQFTSTEKYVYERVQKSDIHWFPIEKSSKFNKN